MTDGQFRDLMKKLNEILAELQAVSMAVESLDMKDPRSPFTASPAPSRASGKARR